MHHKMNVIFIQAKHAIKRILPNDSTSPVVVYNNGAVAFLSKIKEAREGPLSGNDNIVFCDLVKIDSDVCVLCLAQQEVRISVEPKEEILNLEL